MKVFLRGFDNEFLAKFPIVCLVMYLKQQKEQIEGLRPFEEISKNVTEAREILYDNPATYYKIVSRLGEGGQAKIYKIQRLSDDKLCVLKHTSDITDRQAVINESSLMSWLACDQIVQCIELYDYHSSIYIVLELMDGGSLSSIVQ